MKQIIIIAVCDMVNYGSNIIQKIYPIRTVKFARHNRMAQGHIQAAKYMIALQKDSSEN